MPLAQAEATYELAQHFRAVIKCAGNPVGALAILLVGFEMQLAASEAEYVKGHRI